MYLLSQKIVIHSVVKVMSAVSVVVSTDYVVGAIYNLYSTITIGTSFHLRSNSLISTKVTTAKPTFIKKPRCTYLNLIANSTHLTWSNSPA